jgi:hypothetical protein
MSRATGSGLAGCWSPPASWRRWPANLAYGARYGITGALIWGWPAYSFVLVAAGMIAVMKRAARSRAGISPGTVSPPVPSDAETAAMASLRATLAAGNPLSGRQLETRFGLTRGGGDQSAADRAR